MKKYIRIVILSIIIIFVFSTIVLANPIESMKGYEDNANSNFLNGVGGKIYGIILIIGSAVALGGLSVMGIKFMSAAPGEKADIKKNLIGFTIGLVILICAISLLGVFKNIGGEISSAAEVRVI